MAMSVSTPPLIFEAAAGGEMRAADGLWFGEDLSASEPISEAAIERAVDLMRSGRLHRYGEQGSGYPEPSLLEQDYAAYVGSKYCVAVSSCGAAMFIALKALGVKAGDKVLTGSFTLAPVPGAIAHAGAQPVLVETQADYTTDLDDLAHKLEISGAKVFLVSHMRGHITDLQAAHALCDRHGVSVIEDCAHTMGAKYGQRPGNPRDSYSGSARKIHDSRARQAHDESMKC